MLKQMGLLGLLHLEMQRQPLSLSSPLVLTLSLCWSRSSQAQLQTVHRVVVRFFTGTRRKDHTSSLVWPLFTSYQLNIELVLISLRSLQCLTPLYISEMILYSSLRFSLLLYKFYIYCIIYIIY